MGLEPTTPGLEVRCAIHCATLTCHLPCSASRFSGLRSRQAARPLGRTRTGCSRAMGCGGRFCGFGPDKFVNVGLRELVDGEHGFRELGGQVEGILQVFEEV